MRISNWTSLSVVLSFLFVACSEPTSSRPNGGSDPRPGIDAASLNDDKMAELRQYSEGACAVSEVDPSGANRGFAVRRQDLPFAVAPIQHDAKTGRGNGRVVHMNLRRPSGAVALNCWVPNTVTPNDLLRSVSASRSGPWSPVFAALMHAGIIPDSAHRSPLSDEAKAFEAEMLASASAKPITTSSKRGASLNTGCDDVSGEFYYFDGSSWVDIYVEVDVCDDTYGDFLGWIIDNGYADPPSVSVDASNYEITALDSVTFTAHINGGGTFPRLGWTWVPEGGSSWDPWTQACTGNSLTCRIQVHGTGKMYFTIATPSGNIAGNMGVTGTIPDDAGDVGDADSVAYSDAGSTFGPEISELQGEQILVNAILSGEWTYTQGCAGCWDYSYNPPVHGSLYEPAISIPMKFGDCTDYVQTAIKNILGSSWPHTKLSTKMFNRFVADSAAAADSLRKHGYAQVDSAHARAGDVVVRAKNTAKYNGHAGVFVGWAAGGHPIGWANNGSPAGLAPPDTNVDRPTGSTDFKVKSGYITKFFRPHTP